MTHKCIFRLSRAKLLPWGFCERRYSNARHSFRTSTCSDVIKWTKDCFMTGPLINIFWFSSEKWKNMWKEWIHWTQDSVILLNFITAVQFVSKCIHCKLRWANCIRWYKHCLQPIWLDWGTNNDVENRQCEYHTTEKFFRISYFSEKKSVHWKIKKKKTYEKISNTPFPLQTALHNLRIHRHKSLLSGSFVSSKRQLKRQKKGSYLTIFI